MSEEQEQRKMVHINYKELPTTAQMVEKAISTPASKLESDDYILVTL
jgi:hypothetical protein